jgi:drug/metabolite transporter (DMT)-like permease
MVFDLRSIVGTLFTVYGIVCVIWGVAFNTDADSRRSGGIAVNLWAGIGMLVVAAIFFAWVWFRPLPVSEPRDDAPEDVRD